MNRYLKLVQFEWNRFLKIYLVLIAITVLSQIIGVIVEANSYMGEFHEAIYEKRMTLESFLNTTGQMSMYGVVDTLWVLGPIAFGAASLLIYMLLIWYRDWFGKNTFIYRLLMLPTERINVYLAKATTIFLNVLGLIALQLILLVVGSQLLKWIVPQDLRIDVPISELLAAYGFFPIIIPNTWTEFMIHYGIGLLAVLVVFTAILLERSYRLKGIFIGLLYVALSVVVFLAPILMEAMWLPNFFYPEEIFLLMLFTWFINMIVAIGISYYLLRKKIRV